MMHYPFPTGYSWMSTCRRLLLQPHMVSCMPFIHMHVTHRVTRQCLLQDIRAHGRIWKLVDVKWQMECQEWYPGVEKQGFPCLGDLCTTWKVNYVTVHTSTTCYLLNILLYTAIWERYKQVYLITFRSTWELAYPCMYDCIWFSTYHN